MTKSGILPMLSGIKVIDMTRFVTGPTASRILGELGSDVIKVELAPYGDRSRVQGVEPKQVPENAAPYSTYFFQHSHSKRGIALDFKNERARQILKRVIAKADVLVENFSPGVMARAGLAYADLSRLHPRLVMCSISLEGQTGPLTGLGGMAGRLLTGIVTDLWGWRLGVMVIGVLGLLCAGILWRSLPNSRIRDRDAATKNHVMRRRGKSHPMKHPQVGSTYLPRESRYMVYDDMRTIRATKHPTVKVGVEPRLLKAGSKFFDKWLVTDRAIIMEKADMKYLIGTTGA
jgi:hypothetical protein